MGKTENAAKQSTATVDKKPNGKSQLTILR
jgi:hypothetical protein